MSSISNLIRRSLKNDLSTFKWFERTIAAICIAIPLVLRFTNSFFPCTPKEHLPEYDSLRFRSSISNYVYMEHSYVFGMLLTIAAMLFIFNGAVYFKNEDANKLGLCKEGKWYNVVLGLSLLGVVICPHIEYPIPHYTFAIIFFFGNAVVTAFFYNNRDKKKRIALAILTVASFVISLLNNFGLHICPQLTLLWAEWISLFAIAVHFILESGEADIYRQRQVEQS